MADETDENLAMAVQTPLLFTTRKEIRRLRGEGCLDSVFKISKKPLEEVDVNRSPSPPLTFLVQRPIAESSLRTRLANLEAQCLKQEEALKQQQQVIKDLTASQIKEITALEEKLEQQQQAFKNLTVQVQTMDLENFDLYHKKIGLKRPLVAYGILEFVHMKYLTAAALKNLADVASKAPADVKNRCFRFFNTQVFKGKWQQGTYEEIVCTWLMREEREFGIDQVSWMESALAAGECDVLAASDGLKGKSAVELRSGIASALSVNRAKRNIAAHFLSLGDKATRLQVVEDLVEALNSGTLSEYADVSDIMLCGCDLYKASL